MTLWDLGAVAIQRWILTLCCIGLTALAMVWVVNVPPAYLSDVRVVLLRPASVDLNAYTGTSQSLIDLAGVVARAVQGGGGATQSVSGGVTLVGEGVRTGYSVQQANGGGQWQYRFDDPVVIVQAVDLTPDAAKRQMEVALADVTSILNSIQDEQGVAVKNRVRMSLNPATPQLSMVEGSRSRAVAAVGVTGLIVTLSALALLGSKPVRSGLRPRRRLDQARSDRAKARTA